MTDDEPYQEWVGAADALATVVATTPSKHLVLDFSICSLVLCI